MSLDVFIKTLKQFVIKSQVIQDFCTQDHKLDCENVVLLVRLLIVKI